MKLFNDVIVFWIRMFLKASSTMGINFQHCKWDVNRSSGAPLSEEFLYFDIIFSLHGEHPSFVMPYVIQDVSIFLFNVTCKSCFSCTNEIRMVHGQSHTKKGLFQKNLCIQMTSRQVHGEFVKKNFTICTCLYGLS
jgi:hypothetical protein